MVDFGEVLRCIGDFGLFQQLLLFAIGFPNFVVSFFVASLIYIKSDPERHCNTDWILGVGPNLTSEEQLNLTLPREDDGSFSRCRMFVPVDWDVDAIREFGLNRTTGCQDGWKYNSLLYEATIVTDFDLVCDQANLVNLGQALLMAGILIGSLIFGPFAESFGRKRAAQIPLVIFFVFTAATTLSPNIYLYLPFQLLTGVGFGGYQVNTVVLSTEWLGVSRRSLGVCVSQLFISVGQCVLAGLAYKVRNWRLIQLIAAAFPAVAVIYIWFIPESARWLLSRGRSEEARQIIVKAAAVNKRLVPDSLQEKLQEKTVVNPPKKGGIKVLLRSPQLSKYFFIQVVARFSFNLSVFSLYFSMDKLGLSIYVTQLLFGISQTLSVLLSMWLLEVLGRKILFIGTLLAGGLCTMLILAVPEGYAVTCLAAAANFFLLWAGAVAAIYTQELSPTTVRQTATALGIVGGGAGGLMAPMLNMLAVYHPAIPIAVPSSMVLVIGTLGFLLPETKKKELPETAEEVENSFFKNLLRMHREEFYAIARQLVHCSIQPAPSPDTPPIPQ